MEQLKNNNLCRFCLGCNALEDKEFQPKIRCKNFIPGIENWYEKYREAIIKEMEERKK